MQTAQKLSTVLKPLFIGVFALWASHARAAGLEVRAELTFQEPPPAAAFVQKLQATFQAVTLKALKDDPGWEDQQEEYQGIIKDVLERAYRGYRVNDVRLSKKGGYVQASASLKRFGGLVQSVRLVAEYRPLPDVLKDVLAPELRAVKTSLEKLWKDLPEQNALWAKGLMTEQVKDAIKGKKALANFHLTIELEVAAKTDVRLVLRAKEPVIRSITMSLESTLLPNTFMDDIRLALIPPLVGLRGLPAGLLTDFPHLAKDPVHEAFFKVKVVKSLGLQADFRVSADSASLDVRGKVFSNRWRLTGGGQLDVGHDLETGRLDAHIGLMTHPKLELFVEPAVEVDPVRLVGDAGIMFHPVDWLSVGAGRDLKYRKDKWWASLRLLHNIGVSYESRAVSGLQRELGLWYKPNEFYRFGIYHDLDQDVWMRLRANL